MIRQAGQSSGIEEVSTALRMCSRETVYSMYLMIKWKWNEQKKLVESCNSGQVSCRVEWIGVGRRTLWDKGLHSLHSTVNETQNLSQIIHSTSRRYMWKESADNGLWLDRFGGGSQLWRRRIYLDENTRQNFGVLKLEIGYFISRVVVIVFYHILKGLWGIKFIISFF